MMNYCRYARLITGMLLVPVLFTAPLKETPATSTQITVILADPGDPYYSLAQEISIIETAPLISSFNQILSYPCTFLLWVASPEFVDGAALVDFGLFMQEHSLAISTGIITGSTMEKARALWLRTPQVNRLNSYAVNAANPSAQISSGRIQVFDDDKFTGELPLSKAQLTNILKEARYLNFTGHGGSNYWVVEKEPRQELTIVDIPRLPNTAISSGSCQTLQPWKHNSIALRFVDQGAVVYAGFVYSPNEGYLMGEFDDLPFQYTWPDFPIGHVVRVQNRGTVQGFATFPYYFMLGDPRAALQTEAPYHLVEDRLVGNQRVMSFSGAPAGLIPVRIPDGALYSLISADGKTSASENDPFYNSHLQMVNILDDKYVLVVHNGGDFNLRLQIHPPWYWYLSDPLIDSLDHTLLFGLQAGTGGDLIALAGGLISLIIVLIEFRRKPLSRRLFRPAVFIGAIFTALYSLYSFFGIESVTITSKKLAFSPWAALAIGTLCSCGAFLFWSANSRRKKYITLLIPTFPAWLMAAFMFSTISYSGISSSMQIGAPTWNYAIGEMPLLAFCCLLPLFTAIFTFVENWFLKENCVAQNRATQIKQLDS